MRRRICYLRGATRFGCPRSCEESRGDPQRRGLPPCKILHGWTPTKSRRASMSGHSTANAHAIVWNDGLTISKCIFNHLPHSTWPGLIPHHSRDGCANPIPRKETFAYPFRVSRHYCGEIDVSER